MRRLLTLGALVVGGALAFAGPAHAGTASIETTSYTSDPYCSPPVVVLVDTLHFVAKPGETNQLTLTFDAAVPGVPNPDLGPQEGPTYGCPTLLESYPDHFVGYVHDRNPVIAGPRCRRWPPAGDVCMATPSHEVSVRIDLGDGNDELVATDHSVEVDAGSGDDTLRVANDNYDRVDCGDGDDTVTADNWDILVNCEHVTRIL